MLIKLTIPFGLLLVTLSSVVIHGAKGPPRIIGSKEKTYNVNVGDTVKLKCRATGSNDELAMRTLFFWKKMDSKQYIRSSRDFPRYTIKQGRYLKIKNVQLEDSGRYTCSAANQFGLVSAYRTLVVKDNGKGNTTRKKTEKPRKLLAFTVPMPNMMKGDEGAPYLKNGLKNGSQFRNLEHPIGHVARLKCPIVGRPTPSFSWSKNGMPISKNRQLRLGHSSTVLVFKSLHTDDTGNYTCVARNRYGSIQFRFSLKVKSFARFRSPSAKSVRNVTGVLGKNLTLTCRTDLKGRRGGLPRLHWIKWNANLRPQKRFPAPRERIASGKSSGFGDGERSRWEYSSNGNGSLIGKLTLINVTSYDGGRYSCMAGVGRRWSTIEEVHVVILPGYTGSKVKPSKTGISYKVPILILVLVPTTAGLLCIIIAFCCWQFNRKKRQRDFPGMQPPKVTQNGFSNHVPAGEKHCTKREWDVSKEEQKPFLDEIPLDTLVSRTQIKDISRPVKVSTFQSLKEPQDKTLIKGTANGHGNSPTKGHQRDTPTKTANGSVQICGLKPSENCCKPTKGSKHSKVMGNGDALAIPVAINKNKQIKDISKMNGTVNGYKCRSSDAVAVSNKAHTLSSNTETRTL